MPRGRVKMKDVVLILTNSDDDHHVIPVMQVLDRKGARSFRFDSDRIATGELKISYFLSDKAHGFEFTIGGKVLCSDAIKSVWYRRPDFFNLPISDPAQREFAEVEISNFLNGLWLCIPDIFWFSRPWSIERARKKVFQLGLAQTLGFKVPETVVTNVPGVVCEFQRKHGRIIFKPVHQNFFSLDGGKGMTVPTTLITEEHLENIGLVEKTPGLFQRFIEKSYDLRVTVVGQKVFATKIHSQCDELTRVDWRNPLLMEKLKYEDIRLPVAIETMCLKLLKWLDLGFGAFDFAVDNSGDLFFLELNPNGQWQFVEYFTGACISEAIADMLALSKLRRR